MIIVQVGNDDGLYYAASKKSLPALVEDIAQDKNKSIEEVVHVAMYYEFNTREGRIGKIQCATPLSKLVVVSCGLAPTAGDSDEDEDE